LPCVKEGDEEGEEDAEWQEAVPDLLSKNIQT
jgi:hypothetical protein